MNRRRNIFAILLLVVAAGAVGRVANYQQRQDIYNRQAQDALDAMRTPPPPAYNGPPMHFCLQLFTPQPTLAPLVVLPVGTPCPNGTMPWYR